MGLKYYCLKGKVIFAMDEQGMERELQTIKMAE